MSGGYGIVLAFAIFGGGAYLGVRALEALLALRVPKAERPSPFDDRLVGALALVTGAAGAFNVAQSIVPVSLVTIGCFCLVLDFACCADLRFGHVPLAIGLPFAVAGASLDLATGDVVSLMVGLLIATPFAVASLVSKRRAAGLGDAAVAALGGFVLGTQLGVISVALACFAAAGTGLALKRQGSSIPFAPFLALIFQVALFVPAARAL